MVLSWMAIQGLEILAWKVSPVVFGLVGGFEVVGTTRHFLLQSP